MDNDFLNSISPKFDYFSESAIWKNGSAPYFGADFGLLKFNDLQPGFLATGLSLNVPGTFNSQGARMTDYRAISVADANFMGGAFGDLTYERNPLSAGTFFGADEMPEWHIVDAGVSCKSLVGSYNLENLYTTSAAAVEAGGNLSHFLPSENTTLHSFTPREFKENGNIATLTSPFGESSTVAFQRESNGTTYLDCGHVAIF